MINATACFLRKNGKILFLYRNRGREDIHKGYYVPPGGRFERGEMGLESILREFKEETGLTLLEPKLRIIATFYNQERNLGGQKNTEDWQVEFYEACHFTGDLKREDKRDRLFWISENRIKDIKMYMGDRKIIRLLSKEGVYQTIAKYSGEDLIHFKYIRVY